jgi:hypothetical protein
MPANPRERHQPSTHSLPLFPGEPSDLAAPVRALLRCARCSTLTDSTVEVGATEAAASPTGPVLICPDCVRPGEQRVGR